MRLNSWWQLQMDCFTQTKKDPRSNDERVELAPKKPRVAEPRVLKDVHDLITELVAEGWRILYTDGSSTRIKKTAKDRARGVWGLCT